VAVLFAKWQEVVFLRPQFLQGLGQHMPYVFDFPFAGMLSQHPEDGSADLLRVNCDIIFERFFDVIQEIFFVSFSVWLALEIPAFVIKAPGRLTEWPPRPKGRSRNACRTVRKAI
jgi:hypothetical protein